MSFSTQEEARIATIEEKLNELQTVMSRFVTIAQMKQVLLVKQQEVDQAVADIASLQTQVAVLQS